MAITSNLVESIFKCLERRDWDRYQRYIREQERQYGRRSKAQRLNYQEFRTKDQTKYANNR
jgi:hypothetical protein